MYKNKIAEEFNDGFYIAQAKFQPPEKSMVGNKFNTENAK